MKMKKKFMKTLAISMAFSMIFSTNAFATPIDLTNSEMDVKTDTLDKSTGTDYFADEENEWEDGQITERVDVTVQRESQFEVTIPKDIVLDGETGTADYIVNAKGDIAGNQKLSVVPDAEFEMTESGGKDSVTAIVTQNDTEYTYVEMQGDGTNYPGSVQATLTAGEWSGKFAFNISFEGGSSSSTSLPEVKATLNDYTWEEISAISASGEAETTYGLEVGDTKEVEINGNTYNMAIIGFDHDELSDGSGRAGITFQMVELYTDKHVMNSTQTNVGGWEASEMRTYLQGDFYDLLPSELTNEIKIVNKLTSAGNKSTEIVTTQDTLFLPSRVEVFATTSATYQDEGNQYAYYTNNNKIKNKSGSAFSWWLRSPYVSSSTNFYYVSRNGDDLNSGADYSGGVAPAFAI